MTTAAVIRGPNDPDGEKAALLVLAAVVDVGASLSESLANPTVAALARLITSLTLLCVLLAG